MRAARSGLQTRVGHVGIRELIATRATDPRVGELGRPFECDSDRADLVAVSALLAYLDFLANGDSAGFWRRGSAWWRVSHAAPQAVLRT